jgi:hypothetical protein
MKLLLDLTSSPKVSLRIARVLIVVLALLSSRTSVFSFSLVWNGKRPRPSRQALPTSPVRPTTEVGATGGPPPGDPPRMGVEARPPSGFPSVLSCSSHQHLRTETTKPHYLQFFRATGTQTTFSPPA